MTLAEYLRDNRRELPDPGISGVETEWLPFCNLDVSTGSLWAGDPFIANAEDGCTVDVPTGTYVVEAKCMEFRGPKFVSRVRVRLQNTETLRLGKETGEAGTDSASIAVCDIQALDVVIGEKHEAFQELIETEVHEDYGVVEVRFNGVCMMPYVASGFGDGMGPVFEVRSKRELVGMELEFIAPGFIFEVEQRRTDDDMYAKIGALVQAGACTQCSGSGQCYCIRKGSGNPKGCVRCNGSGKCHVCAGRGKR